MSTTARIAASAALVAALVAAAACSGGRPGGFEKPPSGIPVISAAGQRIGDDGPFSEEELAAQGWRWRYTWDRSPYTEFEKNFGRQLERYCEEPVNVEVLRQAGFHIDDCLNIDGYVNEFRRPAWTTEAGCAIKPPPPDDREHLRDLAYRLVPPVLFGTLGC